MGKRGRTEKGFTLTELMVAIAVFLVVGIGFFYVFTLTFELNESSRNLTCALRGAETKLEEIRNKETMPQIAAYDYYITLEDFTNGLPANMTGRVYVDTNSLPYEVTVVVGWTQRGGRQIGDLANTNSPAKIVTLMVNR